MTLHIINEQFNHASYLPPSFFQTNDSKLQAFELPHGGVGNVDYFNLRQSDWRQPVFSTFRKHRDFGNHMVNTFISVCEKKDYFESLRLVQAANDRLCQNGYSSALSDDEIKEMAFRKSQEFKKIISKIESESYRFMRICALIDDLGLAFSDLAIKRAMNAGELFALVNRGCDEIWLRGQLRKKCAYEVEQVARDLSLVQRHKQLYCSDFSVARQRARKSSNRTALEQTVAYDVDNEENYFTLAELSDKSVSNPKIRRSEMFVRLRGFEEIAQESNHKAVFYTLTSPSRFHAVSNGQVNQNWLDANSPTAKDTHSYLLGVWTALRKVLDKKKIKIYGMRIAEPHQDGTPHHHFLLFMKPKDRHFVTTQFKRLALIDSPREAGAKKYRFKAEYIDWSKGSAVGYVAKYLSKNIDGEHIQADKGSSLNGIEAAERVVAWARVNQIRQFQFIGGPSVSVWREMRRLRNEFNEDDVMLNDLNGAEHYLLEKVRRAADIGDWKDFCFAMGGVFVKRADQSVKLNYTVHDAVAKMLESGELSPTRFGDMAQGQINGLIFKNVFILTRMRNWKTENKAKFESAQKQIMRGVVDWFDALEQEREYERMCESHYAEYEAHMQYIEQCEAIMLCSSEIYDMCSVGAAVPDTWH
ncbi:replication endonuclease [Aliivibrio fischeri]|uniref:replication endonuclease n=1 Tax=Aliivibrio fischeri TaxID=668 RepID=UPI001F4537AE|nr:replication endonuclease [Aliivibrio fischeri]MCE7534844.1 replication endonuclease [Aliivibrio fischeri]MCE7557320.1 replication endonuclease [Aliivibrio fischeri]